MFDPERFKPPQPSKWERVMRKHGYHFGCAPAGQYVLIPDKLEEGKIVPVIVGEPGESLRDIFIRQGWLVCGEDGKLREAYASLFFCLMIYHFDVYRYFIRRFLLLIDSRNIYEPNYYKRRN